MLELSNSKGEGSQDIENHRNAGAINIQTSEGYNVQVDATVLYRIVDPLKVMTTIGRDRLFEDNAVIPRATQDLRRALKAHPGSNKRAIHRKQRDQRIVVLVVEMIGKRVAQRDAISLDFAPQGIIHAGLIIMRARPWSMLVPTAG